MDTKLKGDISVSMVLTELLVRGFNVLIPYGDRMPYDLAIDKDKKLITFQVKTAYQVCNKGVYRGNVKISKTNRKQYITKHVCENGDVDFYVYVLQKLNKIYYFKKEDLLLYKSFISFSSESKKLNLENYSKFPLV